MFEQGSAVQIKDQEWIGSLNVCSDDERQQGLKSRNYLPCFVFSLDASHL